MHHLLVEHRIGVAENEHWPVPIIEPQSLLPLPVVLLQLAVFDGLE